MGLFDKPKPPKERVQEWNSKLRKEGYKLDRQIRAIEREQQKVERSLKDAAKKGDKDVCRILAKEIISSRKTISKLYASKAQLSSVGMQMKGQLATIRISGAMEKSTEVMVNMQKLVNVPEVAATMRELSKEMTKAGIIEEMLEDTFESLEGDDLEEEASEEVERVLFELTAGKLGEMPAAVKDTLPEPEPAAAVADEPEEDVTEMQARLEALRS